MSVWKLRLLVSAFVFGGAMCLASGCGSGPPETAGAAGTGSSVGSGGFTGTGASGGGCNSGPQCMCPDGRLGTVRCQDGVSTCSCDGCPTFTPAQPNSFTACGGFPVGRWRSTQADIGALQLKVFGQNGGSFVDECPMQPQQQPIDSYDLRFELHEGGKAEMAFSASMTYDVLLSCVQNLTQVWTCADLNVAAPLLSGYSARGSCSEDACGICSCTEEPRGGAEGTWTRNETKLTLNPSPSIANVYDYCVDGAKLTLQTQAGVVVELERVSVSGIPTTCASRSKEACTSGGHCTLGACVGGSNCTSAGQALCSTLSGCSWAEDQCAGKAPATCKLADYDVVPGCTFGKGTPTCTGTPAPCLSQTVAQCNKIPGCTAKTGCTGGPLDCGQWTGACSICDAKAGCSCKTFGQGAGDCVGTATCEGQSVSECESNFTGCKWGAHCAGTPAPCEQLTELTCADTLGCSVVVAP